MKKIFFFDNKSQTVSRTSFLLVNVVFMGGVLLLFSNLYFIALSACDLIILLNFFLLLVIILAWTRVLKYLIVFFFFYVVLYLYIFSLVLDGVTLVFELSPWLLFDTVVHWSFVFDPLSTLMIGVVLCISILVHFYSLSYMSHDPLLFRFLGFLSLFTFCMLFLVTSNNLLVLFVGWEGVGLCSYFLINFWFTRVQAGKAASKAMIINRIGDICLIGGLLLLLKVCGSIEYSIIFSYFLHLDALDSLDKALIILISFLLLLAAMSKSAQLFLHVWLPDAMEGPTPVSALIHAATMVTAGIFLLIRFSPVLVSVGDLFSVFVSVIGVATAIFAGCVGLAQSDIKKIIAYSTCSQLGYMLFICGLFYFNVAFFHLFIHAIFKALLFLCAGAVIHKMSDRQDVRVMGGLARILPVIYVSLCIGTLGLLGFPFFSGFYSKDLIIEISVALVSVKGFVCFFSGVFTAFITSLYSYRLLFLCFVVKPNGSRMLNKNVIEGEFILLLPLVFLGVLTIFSGFFFKNLFIAPANIFFVNSISYNTEALFFFEDISIFFKLLPFGFVLISLFVYVIFYNRGLFVFFSSRFRRLFTLFDNKLFFDAVYLTFVRFLGFFTLSVFYEKISKGFLEVVGFFGFISLFRILNVRQINNFYFLFFMFFGWFLACLSCLVFFNLLTSSPVEYFIIMFSLLVVKIRLRRINNIYFSIKLRVLIYSVYIYIILIFFSFLLFFGYFDIFIGNITVLNLILFMLFLFFLRIVYSRFLVASARVEALILGLYPQVPNVLETISVVYNRNDIVVAPSKNVACSHLNHYVFSSVGLQLYIVGKQVGFYELERFFNALRAEQLQQLIFSTILVDKLYYSIKSKQVSWRLESESVFKFFFYTLHFNSRYPFKRNNVLFRNFRNSKFFPKRSPRHLKKIFRRKHFSKRLLLSPFVSLRVHSFMRLLIAEYLKTIVRFLFLQEILARNGITLTTNFISYFPSFVLSSTIEKQKVLKVFPYHLATLYASMKFIKFNIPVDLFILDSFFHAGVMFNKQSYLTDGDVEQSVLTSTYPEDVLLTSDTEQGIGFEEKGPAVVRNSIGVNGFDSGKRYMSTTVNPLTFKNEKIISNKYYERVLLIIQKFFGIFINIIDFVLYILCDVFFFSIVMLLDFLLRVTFDTQYGILLGNKLKLYFNLYASFFINAFSYVFLYVCSIIASAFWLLSKIIIVCILLFIDVLDVCQPLFDMVPTKRWDFYAVKNLCLFLYNELLLDFTSGGISVIIELVKKVGEFFAKFFKVGWVYVLLCSCISLHEYYFKEFYVVHGTLNGRAIIFVLVFLTYTIIVTCLRLNLKAAATFVWNVRFEFTFVIILAWYGMAFYSGFPEAAPAVASSIEAAVKAVGEATGNVAPEQIYHSKLVQSALDNYAVVKIDNAWAHSYYVDCQRFHRRVDSEWSYYINRYVSTIYELNAFDVHHNLIYYIDEWFRQYHHEPNIVHKDKFFDIVIDVTDHMPDRLFGPYHSIDSIIDALSPTLSDPIVGTAHRTFHDSLFVRWAGAEDSLLNKAFQISEGELRVDSSVEKKEVIKKKKKFPSYVKSALTISDSVLLEKADIYLDEMKRKEVEWEFGFDFINPYWYVNYISSFSESYRKWYFDNSDPKLQAFALKLAGWFNTYYGFNIEYNYFTFEDYKFRLFFLNKKCFEHVLNSKYEFGTLYKSRFRSKFNKESLGFYNYDDIVDATTSPIRSPLFQKALNLRYSYFLNESRKGRALHRHRYLWVDGRRSRSAKGRAKIFGNYSPFGHSSIIELKSSGTKYSIESLMDSIFAKFKKGNGFRHARMFLLSDQVDTLKNKYARVIRREKGRLFRLRRSNFQELSYFYIKWEQPSLQHSLHSRLILTATERTIILNALLRKNSLFSQIRRYYGLTRSKQLDLSIVRHLSGIHALHSTDARVDTRLSLKSGVSAFLRPARKLYFFFIQPWLEFLYQKIYVSFFLDMYVFYKKYGFSTLFQFKVLEFLEAFKFLSENAKNFLISKVDYYVGGFLSKLNLPGELGFITQEEVIAVLPDGQLLLSKQKVSSITTQVAKKDVSFTEIERYHMKSNVKEYESNKALTSLDQAKEERLVAQEVLSTLLEVGVNPAFLKERFKRSNFFVVFNNLIYEDSAFLSRDYNRLLFGDSSINRQAEERTIMIKKDESRVDKNWLKYGKKGVIKNFIPLVKLKRSDKSIIVTYFNNANRKRFRFPAEKILQERAAYYDLHNINEIVLEYNRSLYRKVPAIQPLQTVVFTLSGLNHFLNFFKNNFFVGISRFELFPIFRKDFVVNLTFSITYNNDSSFLPVSYLRHYDNIFRGLLIYFKKVFSFEINRLKNFLFFCVNYVTGSSFNFSDDYDLDNTLLPLLKGIVDFFRRFEKYSWIISFFSRSTTYVLSFFKYYYNKTVILPFLVNDFLHDLETLYSFYGLYFGSRVWYNEMTYRDFVRLVTSFNLALSQSIAYRLRHTDLYAIVEWLKTLDFQYAVRVFKYSAVFLVANQYTWEYIPYMHHAYKLILELLWRPDVMVMNVKRFLKKTKMDSDPKYDIESPEWGMLIVKYVLLKGFIDEAAVIVLNGDWFYNSQFFVYSKWLFLISFDLVPSYVLINLARTSLPFFAFGVGAFMVWTFDYKGTYLFFFNLDQKFSEYKALIRGVVVSWLEKYPKLYAIYDWFASGSITDDGALESSAPKVVQKKLKKDELTVGGNTSLIKEEFNLSKKTTVVFSLADDIKSNKRRNPRDKHLNARLEERKLEEAFQAQRKKLAEDPKAESNDIIGTIPEEALAAMAKEQAAFEEAERIKKEEERLKKIEKLEKIKKIKELKKLQELAELKKIEDSFTDYSTFLHEKETSAVPLDEDYRYRKIFIDPNDAVYVGEMTNVEVRFFRHSPMTPYEAFENAVYGVLHPMILDRYFGYRNIFYVWYIAAIMYFDPTFPMEYVNNSLRNPTYFGLLEAFARAFPHLLYYHLAWHGFFAAIGYIDDKFSWILPLISKTLDIDLGWLPIRRFPRCVMDVTISGVGTFRTVLYTVVDDEFLASFFASWQFPLCFFSTATFLVAVPFYYIEIASFMQNGLFQYWVGDCIFTIWNYAVDIVEIYLSLLIANYDLRPDFTLQVIVVIVDKVATGFITLVTNKVAYTVVTYVIPQVINPFLKGLKADLYIQIGLNTYFFTYYVHDFDTLRFIGLGKRADAIRLRNMIVCAKFWNMAKQLKSASKSNSTLKICGVTSEGSELPPNQRLTEPPEFQGINGKIISKREQEYLFYTSQFLSLKNLSVLRGFYNLLPIGFLWAKNFVFDVNFSLNRAMAFNSFVLDVPEPLFFFPVALSSSSAFAYGKVDTFSFDLMQKLYPEVFSSFFIVDDILYPKKFVDAVGKESKHQRLLVQSIRFYRENLAYGLFNKRTGERSELMRTHGNFYTYYAYLHVSKKVKSYYYSGNYGMRKNRRAVGLYKMFSSYKSLDRRQLHATGLTFNHNVFFPFIETLEEVSAKNFIVDDFVDYSIANIAYKYYRSNWRNLTLEYAFDDVKRKRLKNRYVWRLGRFGKRWHVFPSGSAKNLDPDDSYKFIDSYRIRFGIFQGNKKKWLNIKFPVIYFFSVFLYSLQILYRFLSLSYLVEYLKILNKAYSYNLFDYNYIMPIFTRYYKVSLLLHPKYFGGYMISIGRQLRMRNLTIFYQNFVRAYCFSFLLDGLFGLNAIFDESYWQRFYYRLKMSRQSDFKRGSSKLAVRVNDSALGFFFESYPIFSYELEQLLVFEEKIGYATWMLFRTPIAKLFTFFKYMFLYVKPYNDKHLFNSLLLLVRGSVFFKSLKNISYSQLLFKHKSIAFFFRLFYFSKLFLLETIYLFFSSFLNENFSFFYLHITNFITRYFIIYFLFEFLEITIPAFYLAALNNFSFIIGVIRENFFFPSLETLAWLLRIDVSAFRLYILNFLYNMKYLFSFFEGNVFRFLNAGWYFTILNDRLFIDSDVYILLYLLVQFPSWSFMTNFFLHSAVVQFFKNIVFESTPLFSLQRYYLMCSFFYNFAFKTDLFFLLETTSELPIFVVNEGISEVSAPFIDKQDVDFVDRENLKVYYFCYYYYDSYNYDEAGEKRLSLEYLSADTGLGWYYFAHGTDNYLLFPFLSRSGSLVERIPMYNLIESELGFTFSRIKKRRLSNWKKSDTVGYGHMDWYIYRLNQFVQDDTVGIQFPNTHMYDKLLVPNYYIYPGYFLWGLNTYDLFYDPTEFGSGNIFIGENAGRDHIDEPDNTGYYSSFRRLGGF